MTGVVRWEEGGEALLVRVGREEVVLRSTVPAPPGARLRGIVVLGGPPPRELAVRVKVHSCRKEGEGAFALAGRFIDLTREGLRALMETTPPA